MARTNKYTSINFNHVYDKNLTTNNNNNPNFNSNQSKQPSYSSISSPSSYKTHLASSSSSRSHGRMLVLTRPAPKPTPTTTTTAPLSPSPQISDTQLPNRPDQPRSETQPDLISLRPSGRTGSTPTAFSPIPVPEKEKEVGIGKFVPPHLRPGFVGKEDKPGPEVFRGKEATLRQPPQQGSLGFESGPGSPGGYGESGRPKSGGGYDRVKRDGKSDVGFINCPRSSGNRPNSSG